MVVELTPTTMHNLKVFINSRKRFRANPDHEFPSFLPKETNKIKDPFAINMAMRNERLTVQVLLVFVVVF